MDISFPVEDDVVDCNFPKDDDDGDEEALNAIPWRDVTLNEWYRVLGTHSIKTVHGDAKILQLQKKDGNVYRVWATQVIAQSIVMKEKEQGRLNLFIKSKGKKDCKKSNKFYYDFRFKIQ